MPRSARRCARSAAFEAMRCECAAIMKEARGRLGRGVRLALICALALGAAIAITQFPASGNDDTHITYWAAHALAEYGRIVNYNGAAIEQSSSLGLVLLLALVERVAYVAPPWSAPFLSIV